MPNFYLLNIALEKLVKNLTILITETALLQGVAKLWQVPEIELKNYAKVIGHVNVNNLCRS